MSSALEDASRLVVAFLEGKADQAQVQQQLLELNSDNAEIVGNVFALKANAVLQQAGAGHFQRSQKAGCALVFLASGLDRELRRSTEEDVADTVPPAFAEVLLEDIIEMTGGPLQAPKNKAQRAQAVSFISGLVSHVGDHAVAKATLLEYAEDTVPGIREKALQALSHMTPDDDVSHRLTVCSADLDKAVRTAAVSAMGRICGRADSCLASLLSRLDDTDACVRQAVFNALAEQQDILESLPEGTLARLVVGLSDGSPLVRDAAKKAVPLWVDHCGGPVQFLAKCDVSTDELLSEECAKLLSACCESRCFEQSCEWLRSGGQCFHGLSRHAALLTRFSLAFMGEDQLQDAVNIPDMLRMVRDAMSVASQCAEQSDFFLRQLLHCVALLDFCDEASRRDLSTLSIDVFRTAPVSSEFAAIPQCGNRMKATAHTTMDLGMLLLRKCYGFDRKRSRQQENENRISQRVMALLNELTEANLECALENPAGEARQSDEKAEPQFIVLSRKLEAIAERIMDLEQRKVAASEGKDDAIDTGDFDGARLQRDAILLVEAELEPLKVQHAACLTERDGFCNRILAIVAALLRWTHSDIRKDGALLGMLTSVVRPILTLEALSEEVNLRALHAIGLFCSLDVELAQKHWGFFIRLVTNLKHHVNDPTTLRRAMLAATTLSDCSRLHGLNGLFDRDQVLSAASVLAIVPYRSRAVAIYPLCAWLMSFGALYFEEHMTNPQPELTWALGWMLTEAFSTKPREGEVSSHISTAGVEEDHASDSFLKAQAADLMMFFNILSKHPGRHGEALLCLAVESVVETGLWRCAVSVPVDVHCHEFTRGFSWPTMFEFVQTRLPDVLQLRLWRCCLQACVTSPSLAPWAHIPLALATGISKAPPGVAELVKAAISLGADADALSSVINGLPPLEDISIPDQVELLRSQAKAVESEQALQTELSEVGVVMSDWRPPIDMKAPRGKPALAVDGALRMAAMRSVCHARRTAIVRSRIEKALTNQDDGENSRDADIETDRRGRDANARDVDIEIHRRVRKGVKRRAKKNSGMSDDESDDASDGAKRPSEIVLADSSGRFFLSGA